MHKKRPRAVLTKNRDVMKAGTLQTLREDIERRLCAAHPEIWLRIDKNSSLMVSGTRNDREKENVIETLEAIWQDDNWLPAA
ncbi:DinI-like family protein [Salmonella enterica]|nr:DinI-like family protein [Salmonella enterica]